MAAVNSKQTLASLEVRVLDRNKKSSFRIRSLPNFPVVETMTELRKELGNSLPELIECIQHCELGFVQGKNKKISVVSDQDLDNAYCFFAAGHQMWLDPSTPKETVEASTKAGQKRRFESSKDSCSKNEQILQLMEELKELHGKDQLQPYKYRMWAEMILVGTAKKERMPESPMFTNNPAKRPTRRDTAIEAFTSVGQSIANALQPTSSATVHDENKQIQTSTSNRSEVLKQMKDLFELKTLGAITEDEYKTKKEEIMKHL